MDKHLLYDVIAERKSKPKDFEPYDGNNGRVNRCVQLFEQKKLKTGDVLLDVGGGIGDLGFEVRKCGFFKQTIVLDISMKNLDAALAKGNLIAISDVDSDGLTVSPTIADKTDHPFHGPFAFLMNPGRIDCVTALDFIEHIIDPEGFARECHRVLKSGGEVFINTPNIRYWEHIQELLVYGRFPHTSGDREVFHGGHLAFFSYADLCEIFGRAGFSEFQRFHDDEGYKQPPERYISFVHPTNQQQFVEACEEFGNPNLLFKAVKP